MGSFADLGVRPLLVSALARRGIEQPFPIQEQTLPDALAGRDICGQAKTGSGKTLAFAIPLVQRLRAERQQAPRALVLVPTRELAVQVVEVVRPLAQAAGLRSLAVYGGASLDRQCTAARRGVDIVVATPGRLIDLVDRADISLDRIEIAVVDEADRMADMGFLPQVERLLRRFTHRTPQLMLFSATLDGAANLLVRKYLHDPVRHDAEPPDEAKVFEMAHRFLAVHQLDRVLVVAAISRPGTRTLVFVRTKRGADRLTAQLAREGVRAGAIHGDLRQSARERALRSFSSGSLDVLVATDVAARGIHVDAIDTVIHFDPAEDHKAYLHRSGRTARAGQTGVVVSFVLWNQVLDTERLQKRLGLSEPIVEVFSNDERLADLASLSPVPVAS